MSACTIEIRAICEKSCQRRVFRCAKNHPAGLAQRGRGVALGLFQVDRADRDRQINRAFQADQLEASRESTVCWALVGW